MSYQTLLFEVRDGVGFLTLNRPEAANALDLRMAEELLDVATRCEQDSSVRAVLIAANGKLFCAGGDLRSFAAAGDGMPALLLKVTDALHAAIEKLARLGAPTIAAVQGAAAGAGMSLACSADFAIAAESAKFTMAYTAAGLTPDGSSTYFLPRTIGVRRTKELMLTNRRLSASEALEWDLVNRVVPDDQLLAEAEKLARTLAAGATRAFAETKRMLVATFDVDIETQLADEGRTISAMTTTTDGREGIAAFLEKRAPKFTGS